MAKKGERARAEQDVAAAAAEVAAAQQAVVDAPNLGVGETGKRGPAGHRGTKGTTGKTGASFDDSELAAALRSFVDSRLVLHDAVELVSKKQDEDRDAAKRRRLWGAIAAAGVLVAVFFAGRYLVDSAAVNRENGRILLDCTTPSPKGGPAHKCHEQGQAQTGAAVLSVVTEVDCRTREALAGLPPTPDGQSCVEAQRAATAPSLYKQARTPPARSGGDFS